MRNNHYIVLSFTIVIKQILQNIQTMVVKVVRALLLLRSRKQVLYGFNNFTNTIGQYRIQNNNYSQCYCVMNKIKMLEYYYIIISFEFDYFQNIKYFQHIASLYHRYLPVTCRNDQQYIYICAIHLYDSRVYRLSRSPTRLANVLLVIKLCLVLKVTIYLDFRL